MSKYAWIKFGHVINIVEGNSLSEEFLTATKEEHGLDAIILADNMAVVIGAAYNGKTFVVDKPYPSWVWNSTLGSFEAPVAKPTTQLEKTQGYVWDESTNSWKIETLITP
jgi:hypothetical protein